MKLLIFEWLAGGGLWIDGEIPDGECSMQQQGLAMLQGLALDLSRAGYELVVPQDSRLNFAETMAGATPRIASAAALRTCLNVQAKACDGIVLIAPEIGGCLAECCRWIEPYQRKLLSPGLAFIELAADKQAIAEFLTSGGVAVPQGRRIHETEICLGEVDFPLPAVIKPVDGAGSEQVQYIADWNEFRRSDWLADSRIECFVPGQSVSVSVLCGGSNRVLLPPTGQIFDAAPIGHYIGTQFPLEPALAERATRLALQTIAALPPTIGYIGIDMILGDSRGRPDCVVDINPRLTMSYLKLREICDFNIASKMIELAISDMF
jgi:predicted ATP-grasp superfamily ATP-dependent carboligase